MESSTNRAASVRRTSLAARSSKSRASLRAGANLARNRSTSPNSRKPVSRATGTVRSPAFSACRPSEGPSPRASGRLDEAVDHPLAAAGLERDLELVAFLVDDLAVAELVVEHAHADREVGARLGGEARGAAAGLLQSFRGLVVARGQRTLPARTARLAAFGPSRADVGERIVLLGPVGAPQRGAAGQRGFHLDVVGGELGDEPRGDRAGPLAVDAPVGSVEDRAAAPGAGDRDVSQPAFLLERSEAAFV